MRAMDETPTPFDEFQRAERAQGEPPQSAVGGLAARLLQGLSLSAATLAIVLALGVVGLHIVRGVAATHPDLMPGLKSAVPLIAIGVAYLSLIFTVPRTAVQRFLGFLVALAFILWGAEQYMSNAFLISLIDDFVVVLFVFDLFLVIRENLKKAALERENGNSVS